MYKVCTNCGFMYDDSLGCCPGCQNNDANTTENSKPETPIQELNNTNNTAFASGNVSETKTYSKPAFSFNWKKIAIFAILLAVLVGGGALIFIAIGRNQSYDGNNVYYDENNAYNENDSYYELQDFYVYFNPNNGGSQDSVYMNSAGLVPEPNEPVRNGYEFDGWYTDEYFNEEWCFDSDEAYETLTLYAKWVEDESNEKLVLAVDGLRLRSRPSMNGSQIGLIPNGTKITITEIKNGWAYTSYKGVEGWCSCDFLYNPADYENQALFRAYVKNRNGINLYSESSTSSSVEKQGIKYRSYVQVYEVDDDWSYVYYNGDYGWCLSKDIDDIE